MRLTWQEPAGNLVHINGAGPAGPGEVSLSLQLGQVAPGGTLRDAGVDGERANRREASAGVVSKADEALHRPSEAGLQRAIDIESDGDKGEHSSPLTKSSHPEKDTPYGMTDEDRHTSYG